MITSRLSKSGKWFSSVMTLLFLAVALSPSLMAAAHSGKDAQPGVDTGKADAIGVATVTIAGAEIGEPLRPAEPLNDTQLLDHWRDTGGQALLVWRDGELVVEAYATSFNASSIFRSYSLHKSVVGLTAAILHTEGVINLDKPITEYLTPKSPYDDVFSLRDTLQHRTGLSNIPFLAIATDDNNLPDAIEAATLGATQIATPDSFRYSNTNYQLAGIAMKNALAAKSLSYDDFLSDRIWRPIGADDAFVHIENGSQMPHFYAGLYTTARSWLRLGMLIANDGAVDGEQIVPSAALEAFARPASHNSGYGLGAWLGAPANGQRVYSPEIDYKVTHSAPFAYDDVIFFDGFGGQRVYISPSEKLVVVRLGEVRTDWDDAVLFNLAAQITIATSE